MIPSHSDIRDLRDAYVIGVGIFVSPPTHVLECISPKFDQDYNRVISFSVGREDLVACHPRWIWWTHSTAQFLRYSSTFSGKGFDNVVSIQNQGGHMTISNF